MTHTDLPLRAQAERVIAVSAAAWRIAPVSARAVARRAPHGHVPMRALRRLQQAANRALPGRNLLAHSW
ncbi:MAG: hypothetical protein EOP81_01230 [Variovorax sp.]|nr:MAG: hypothetical protein EOP81_01230 [Variovorax sp.]